MVPLKMRLCSTIDPPVGVAQVIVQDRISRFQGDGALKGLRRLGELSKLEVRPTQAVHNIAVRWLQLDRSTEQLESFLKFIPWSTHEYPK